MAGCYLARHGLPGGNALRTVGRLFQETAKGRGGRIAPETSPQAAFVRRWPAFEPDARAHQWEDRLAGGLVGLAVGAVGHLAAVWAAKRDAQFVDVVRRHLRYPSFFNV